MRRAWRCPCEGDPGAPEDLPLVDAWRARMASETGVSARLETCPWRALANPEVRAAHSAYVASLQGEHAVLSSLVALDLAPALIDGVRLYSDVIDRLRAADRKAAERKLDRGRRSRVRSNR